MGIELQAAIIHENVIHDRYKDNPEMAAFALSFIKFVAKLMYPMVISYMSGFFPGLIPLITELKKMLVGMELDKAFIAVCQKYVESTEPEWDDIAFKKLVEIWDSIK